MSKFKRFIAIPCVIIFIALYLIGANLVSKIDKVKNISDAVPYTETEGESNAKSVSDKINLNDAGIDELITIEGIGEDIAQKIIEKREELGGFKSIEEVKSVYGIGNKKFENMKDKITVE